MKSCVIKFLCRRILLHTDMACLLVSITVLHLVTLAMLFIATLEKSVQALMILSVVFSSVSFLVFLGQLFILSRGSLFYFTGFCQAFAGFTDFAACLIFTFHREEILQKGSRDLNKGHFGYCVILAWLCIPLLLVSGVLYLHLRKKQ
ncbi:hypothetical protein GOODEAATRI_027398 [Goodea atripinnis]|uniref:Epithelial membrane protein 3 n=1 Tax=Goodea atripinnis TaxID=208336 RepID=A0ABV0NNN3_9TELE